MGKLLDWDNMPPVGTKVVFKGYRNGNHKHWGFKVGKTYYVGKGTWPSCNYGNDFIFELATPFTINAGDYIDSQQFSREECERFCELAVECGFARIGDIGLRMRYSIARPEGIVDSVGEGWSGWFKFNLNNITTQFREFLDKEKGVKKFTKADLKDGMRLTDREGIVHYVCGDKWVEGGDTGKFHYEYEFSDEFLDLDRSNSNFDIVKVTDRDGTVLFEREEEPRELTIEEIAEAFNLPVELVRIKK